MITEQERQAATPASSPRGSGGRLRIALVTHGYPPLQTGGAEAQAQRKARWWQQRGHDVRVFSADARPPGSFPFDIVEVEHDVVAGVEVCRLRFAAPDASRPFADTFRHALLGEPLERELRTFEPDLVYQVSGYLFGVHPVEIANRLNVPAVLFVTDFWHVCARFTMLRPDGTCCAGARRQADCAACRFTEGGRVATLRAPQRVLWNIAAQAGRVPVAARALGVAAFADRDAAVAAALDDAALVISNSRFLADQLRQAGVRADRLLVVRQGLSAGDLKPVADRRAEGPLRILYLGQIARHKGVDLIVDAVRALAGEGRDARLAIHGQPTGDAGYLARMRTAHDGVRVTFGDTLGRDQLAGAFARADVLVVASRWYENSPNVILEAFASRVPVVVAGHGGMAELVRDGVDGLHFRPGDAASLAATLRRLIDEPLLLATLRSGIRPPHDVDTEMLAEQAALERVLAVWRARAVS